LHQQPTKLPERNLDVLRAIAVLCVLADHVAIAATAPGNVAWGWVGRAGVLIFFVHTALVLMGSLERSGGSRAGWIERFYIRRALRIYPLAIAAIFFVLVLRIPPHTPHIGLLEPYHAPDADTVLANLLLAQNVVAGRDVIGVLWTLPIEVQMYVALPLCFLVARRGMRGVLVLIAAGMLGAIAFRAELPIPGLWRLTMLEFVPCFLGGVLAYALLRKRLAKRIPGGLWLVAIGILLAAFAVARASYESLLPQWAFCLSLGLVIPFVREIPQSRLARAGHVLAKYSYGIYLLHIPALWLAFVPFGGAPHAVQWVLFAFFVCALPWAAYHLVERPGIRAGQRLVHQPLPAATPVGAP
jgi:peptidoglycan/LPS O-acetylase OafA/YrhL